jgi:helix-turn-helix protein
METMIQPHYLNTREAAAYLGVSYQTLNIWRWKHYGPRFVLVSTRPRYTIADLDAFVASCHTRRKSSPNVGRPPKRKRAAR